MKRIGLIATVGIFFALSPHCAAGTTTPPASQQSKAETFLLVQVKGTIGEDFTAAKLKAAISEARAAKAAAIVLSMDTPGGSVTEAEAIVNLIIENQDLRFVALVNKALSAGAAITLACKEIYVMETATIGAAVSYIPDRRGIPVELPADVAEKFQSAWRAVCRKAADCGGHSSLLAEGMADPGFAITKRTENGKVIPERDGKGELIKAAGRILTLTAKEAVVCGLAKAVVSSPPELGRHLGLVEMRIQGSEKGETVADVIGKAIAADIAGDSAKADELLKNLCTTHSESPVAWLAYATHLNKHKNHALALTAAETAIRLAPGLAEGHMETGRAEHGLTHYSEAVTAFKSLLAISCG